MSKSKRIEFLESQHEHIKQAMYNVHNERSEFIYKSDMKLAELSIKRSKIALELHRLKEK